MTEGPDRDGVDEAKRATLRRFAALGAVPLAGAGEAAATGGDGPGRDGTGDATRGAPSETPLSRDAIAGYVAETPGAHFSKLRDDLGLGTGAAQHHLRRLLEDGRLESHRDGDYRRFFPAGRFDEHEQVALGYLRRETARGVVLALLREPGRSGTAIAEDLEVSRATVSGWAGRLEEAGLLSRTDGYRLVDPETLLVLVVRYADSLGPDAVAFAAEAPALVRLDP